MLLSLEAMERKSYEIGYLVRDEEGTSALVGHLKRYDAEVLLEGETRSIKLAYPVRHLLSAYFGYIHFKVDPGVIGDLNNALKLNSQIIRFLIVTPPFTKERSQRLGTEPVRPEKRAIKPNIEFSEKPEAVVSNDLLEEKLEEILNK